MTRIIPRLDIKGQNLVKGVHLEGLRVLGLPEKFARLYFEQGADELLYMDVVASLYGRNNLEDVVRRTARDVYIPITVGGGIRSVDDIRTLLRAGADKVAINTAATADPDLIRRGAEAFGSQCIVVSIEAIRSAPGQWDAYTDNGREPTGRDVIEWAVEAESLGAGEILITSVDAEGTGKGFDQDLVKRISKAVSVPVIACGGAGTPDHVAELVKTCSPGAVSAASMFHYGAIQDMDVEKREEGNVDYLKNFFRGRTSLLDKFETISVGQLKDRLGECGLHVATNGTCGPKRQATIRQSAGNTAPHVAVADYGCGNLFSVVNALEAAGAKVSIEAEPEKLLTADKVVLAGVGSFGDGMRGMAERGLDEAVREFASQGKDILGICLGMQLMLSAGEEFGSHAGLDLVPGNVVRMSVNGDGARIPHIGWSSITPGQGREFTDPLLKGVAPGSAFYFVHSFMVIPGIEANRTAITTHGPNEFCSVLRAENLSGCQFHPERSGPLGLKIYENWISQG